MNRRTLLRTVLTCAVMPSCHAGTEPALPELQSDATDWSPRNALVLAEAAALAYDSAAADRIKAALRCDSCEMLTFPLELPHKFEFEEGEPGPQAFLAAGNRHIVIGFRGTEINLTELLTDALAHPIQLDAGISGKAHAGFAATFNLIWPDLKAKLSAARTKFPDARIWITGHSLGGAMAGMAAARISIVEKVPVQGVITFGAPVSGEEAFHTQLATALGPRHWRVV